MEPARPVVALVTAFNEAPTIGEVIRVLRATPGIARVHVLDDGSTDETAAVARAAGAIVCSLPKRVPVGEAILRGVEAIEEEDVLLLFCDADLVGLQTAHVRAVVRPVLAGQAAMSVGVKDSLPLTPWTVTAVMNRLLGPVRGRRVIGWMVREVCQRRGLLLGGERILSKGRFLEAYHAAPEASGYGLVIVLNAYCFRNGLVVAATFMEGCTHREKFQKWSPREALAGITRLLVQIPAAYARAWAAPRGMQGPSRPHT